MPERKRKKKPRRPIFQLVRPCENCPFRNDRPPFLTAARARSIAEELSDPVGAYFMCHKTWDYGESRIGTKDFAVCAGSLVCMKKGEGLNRSARIGAALGIFDPDRLDLGSPVFDGLQAWVAAHDEAEARRRA